MVHFRERSTIPWVQASQTGGVWDTDGKSASSHPQSPHVTNSVRDLRWRHPGRPEPRVEVAIMTRSEFDDIRAHIAAEADHASDLLGIARTLLDDLEQAHMREAALRSQYLSLLTAARATVAAEATGYAEPLTFLKHELDKRGQLPVGDEMVHRILADARTAAELLACVEETPPRSVSRGRVRRCGGISRRLPH
jgi:hypothetical protein